MAHTASAPRGVVLRPDVLVIIALAAVLGFTLGQTWELPASPSIQTAAPVEDWHGNVRRSAWLD